MTYAVALRELLQTDGIGRLLAAKAKPLIYANKENPVFWRKRGWENVLDTLASQAGLGATPPLLCL